MKAVEFEIVLEGQDAIAISRHAAALLPSNGKARVIVLFDEAMSDDTWRLASYEQFMKNDEPEDAIYDNFAEDR